jgi:hypothetical protein
MKKDAHKNHREKAGRIMRPPSKKRKQNKERNEEAEQWEATKYDRTDTHKEYPHMKKRVGEREVLRKSKKHTQIAKKQC